MTIKFKCREAHFCLGFFFVKITQSIRHVRQCRVNRNSSEYAEYFTHSRNQSINEGKRRSFIHSPPPLMESTQMVQFMSGRLFLDQKTDTPNHFCEAERPILAEGENE